MSNSTISCFTANPDVAGIGFRLAIYVQAILTLLVIGIQISDGNWSIPEQRASFGQSTSILATACALLIAAVVQWRRLNIYHALITLNLSWINSMGTMNGQEEDFERGCFKVALFFHV